MSKSHLVPEVRTDKNGVASIRWVRSEEPIKKTETIELDMGMFKTKSEATVLKHVFDPMRYSSMTDDRLYEMEWGALLAVDRLVGGCAGKSLSWEAESSTSKAFDEYINNGSVTQFNNLAVFGEAVIKEDSRRYDVVRLVEGLSFSEPKDYLLDATDEEREQAIALVTLTARLDDEFVENSGSMTQGPYRLKSDALAALVLERPHEIARIQQIIEQRKSVDTDFIRLILNGNKPLSDGIL